MTAIALRPSTATLVIAVVVVAIASLGASLTDLGPWYQSLRQPAWKPPDELFGVAWTLIFAAAAFSALTGWRDAPNAASRQWLIGLFVSNGLLNLFWSLLFFQLQRPDWALFEVVALWLSILCLMLVLARYSKTASWFLAPYLLWVSFAGALNFAVVRLNAPF